MDKTLFNFHDIILLLTSFECFALGAIFLTSKRLTHLTYQILAWFFIVHGFIALHELILWGASFREWIYDLSPNLFFVFNLGYWLDGPLLYLFVVSFFANDFRLNKRHLLHLVPASLFLVFMWFAFWQLPTEQKGSLVLDYQITYSAHYVSVDLVSKLLRIGYVTLALVLVLNLRKQLPLGRQATWLLYMLLIFLAVLIWECLLTAQKVYGLFFAVNFDIIEVIGLIAYYVTFALVNLVIYVMLSESLNTSRKRPSRTHEQIDVALLEKLEKAMKEEKLFTNPLLSFERLAEQLDISVKDLSNAINRHFNINFNEYINNYRIEEAKAQLADPANKSKTITEIFYSAGFNSKSVYNTLFKKKFHMTPSEFRKKARNQPD